METQNPLSLFTSGSSLIWARLHECSARTTEYVFGIFTQSEPVFHIQWDFPRNRLCGVIGTWTSFHDHLFKGRQQSLSLWSSDQSTQLTAVGHEQTLAKKKMDNCYQSWSDIRWKSDWTILKKSDTFVSPEKHWCIITAAHINNLITKYSCWKKYSSLQSLYLSLLVPSPSPSSANLQRWVKLPKIWYYRLKRLLPCW